MVSANVSYYHFWTLMFSLFCVTVKGSWFQEKFHWPCKLDHFLFPICTSSVMYIFQCNYIIDNININIIDICLWYVLRFNKIHTTKHVDSALLQLNCMYSVIFHLSSYSPTDTWTTCLHEHESSVNTMSDQEEKTKFYLIRVQPTS